MGFSNFPVTELFFCYESNVKNTIHSNGQTHYQLGTSQDPCRINMVQVFISLFVSLKLFHVGTCVKSILYICDHRK